MVAVYKVTFGNVFANDSRANVSATGDSKTVAAKDAEDAIRKVRAVAKKDWVHDCDVEGNFTKKKIRCVDIVVDSVVRVSGLDIP